MADSQRIVMSPEELAFLVDSLSDEDFETVFRAARERRCREEFGYGTFAEACREYFVDPTCPRCGSTAVAENGFTRSGIQRYVCRACSDNLDAPAGTAIGGMRVGFPTFAEFVVLMRHNATIGSIAGSCGVTHTLAFEWRHRVPSSVRGYQDRVTLRDKVWIDETPVDDTEPCPKLGNRRSQGLSKEKACICFAIDSHTSIVARRAGNGKPSGKRVLAALGGNIERGSTIIDDMEKAHNLLARQVGGKHTSFKADTNDPACLKNLAPVNNLCSWIKRYLWRFPGMETRYLQDCLDWYVHAFRVNHAKDKWPQTQRIIRHLILTRID